MMTDRPEMEAKAWDGALPAEGDVLPPGAWTFAMVEDRLVEAMLTLWRLDDPERDLLRQRSKDGPWHLVLREAHRGDYDARGGIDTGGEVAIKPASVTRVEYGEMEEALGWVERWAGTDAKLVGLVITKLAAGRREVPWRDLLPRLGLRHGADGLRMRYGRVIHRICVRLNGGNPRATLSTP